MRYKLKIQTNDGPAVALDSSPKPERIYRLFERMAAAEDVILRQGDSFVASGKGYRSRVWVDTDSEGLFGGGDETHMLRM